MTIRDYLSVTARAISDHARIRAADRPVAEHRLQLIEMLGIDGLVTPAPRLPPPVTITGVVERQGYRIEKLHYESLPGLHVTANLYLPTVPGKAPAVIYTCGHAAGQKAHYQAHARRFAQLGFVCLIVDTIQLGEAPGVHHGCYQQGWFHWYSRGYTPAGIETWNAMRGLDLLAARPEVDAARLGSTGASGGAAICWFLSAVDERVKVAAPSCGTGTLASHLAERTVDTHCDCMWWINTREWDLADVGALIAPRPLLLSSADRDALFTIASIREAHATLAVRYAALQAAAMLQLVEVPGRHAYHARSRTAIFSWFVRHLLGKEIPPTEIGDVDESPAAQEATETLQVYAAGHQPAGNRSGEIHDALWSPPAPPALPDAAAVSRERARLIAALRDRTFAWFPKNPPPVDARVEYEWAYGNHTGLRFTFNTEENWRLAGKVHLPTHAGPADPIMLALRSPGERQADDTDTSFSYIEQLGLTGVRAVVEPRGTGESAWGEELNWHVRRGAAWTGRTIAALRIWDVLRALEAVRTLPVAAGRPIALVARGEMAVVALYAALLDGKVSALHLESLPPTLNQASSSDGRGPAIELLGALRIADLPQIAALMAPTVIHQVRSGT